jgi:hypothetical protein
MHRIIREKSLSKVEMPTSSGLMERTTIGRAKKKGNIAWNGMMSQLAQLC